MDQDPLIPKPRGSETRLLAATVGVFVATACAAYLLVEVAGVNVPLYYPTLQTFSVLPIAGQTGVAIYGQFAAALGMGLLAAAGFLLLSPVLRALHMLRVGFITVLAYTTTWLTVSLLVVKTWHDWGIERRGLETIAGINAELRLFFVGVAIFLLGVLITAAAVRRIATLNPPGGVK